jgi:hypothetical protein
MSGCMPFFVRTAGPSAPQRANMLVGLELFS